MSCSINDQKLYMIGGQTVRVDCLDLESGEWKRINDMKTRRMECQTFSWESKVYALGGYDYTNGHYHDSIEEFDVIQEKWQTLSITMKQPLRSFGLAVIEDIFPCPDIS